MSNTNTIIQEKVKELVKLNDLYPRHAMSWGNSDADKWLHEQSRLILTSLVKEVREEEKKKPTIDKIQVIALYYGTLKELYGEEIAKMVQHRVNAKAEALNRADLKSK